jgi:hypothetical protein
MFRSTAALATVALLALGTAACGDDTTTNSKAASNPKPVGQIDALSGQKTEVTLDPGFVDTLGTLKLTLAPVGDGKITKAGIARFPITGGNVTYYEPGSVSPFVCMKEVGLSSGVRGVAPGLIGLVSGEGGRVKRGLAQA